MLKKISAILIVFIIITVSSVTVFAGQTEDSFVSAIPAASTGTTSATTSTTSAATGITNNSTQQGSSSSGSSIVPLSTGTGNAASVQSIVEEKKPDFEAFIENVMENGKAVDNDLKIMDITSPETEKESTYDETYVLSGTSTHSDVVVIIARYDDETGRYERIENTDGESTWEIGSIRIFTKEIKLKLDTNKLMIISYRASQKEEATLDNIQINCFTIERLNKSITEEIVKRTKEAATNIGDSIKSLMNIFIKN